MNKKLVIFLIICFVSLLTLGGVSAANLQHHDFDDYFSMDVPKGTSFEKQDSSTNENGMELTSISYASDEIMIVYMDTPLYSENSSAFMYQSLFESLNVDLTECYESQEDNLIILEPTTNDGVHFSIVGTISGSKMIILAGLDTDLLKEMGHTIEFK